MMWIIGMIGSKAMRYLATIGTALLAIVAFGASMKRKGRKQAERRARGALNEARNNAREIEDETREDIDGMRPDDVKRVLRERYGRD